MMDSVDIISKILKEELGTDPNLELLIIFGSVVSGKMRSDSDVDIAVKYADPLTVEQRLNLSAQLERRLQRSVDLIDLHALNGVILKKILTKGMVLIKTSEVAYEGLLHRMIYNQQDMMPYYHRTLKMRLKRFLNG